MVRWSRAWLVPGGRWAAGTVLAGLVFSGPALSGDLSGWGVAIRWGRGMAGAGESGGRLGRYLADPLSWSGAERGVAGRGLAVGGSSWRGSGGVVYGRPLRPDLAGSCFWSRADRRSRGLVYSDPRGRYLAGLVFSGPALSGMWRAGCSRFGRPWWSGPAGCCRVIRQPTGRQGGGGRLSVAVVFSGSGRPLRPSGGMVFRVCHWSRSGGLMFGGPPLGRDLVAPSRRDHSVGIDARLVCRLRCVIHRRQVVHSRPDVRFAEVTPVDSN